MNNDNIKTVTTNILKAIKSVWVKYDDNIKNNIYYHYTSSDGLIGIIDTKSLWATCIDFLNDPNELTYGIKLCQDIVGSIEGINENLKLSLTVYFSIFSEERKLQDLTSDLYIISFCEQPEILGQWRLYGNSGKGYCLGINIDETVLLFPEFESDENNEVIFSPCKYPKPVIYNKDQQLDLIRNIIKEVDREIGNFYQENPEIYLKEDIFPVYLSAARYIIDNILPFIKKPEFYDEKEWRIVIPFDNNMKRYFRSEHGIIIPYTRLNFYNKVTDNDASLISIPINKIIIGQALNYKRALQGLRYLLKSYKHNDIDISKSNIDFIE